MVGFTSRSHQISSHSEHKHMSETFGNCFHMLVSYVDDSPIVVCRQEGNTEQYDVSRTSMAEWNIRGASRASQDGEPKPCAGHLPKWGSLLLTLVMPFQASNKVQSVSASFGESGVRVLEHGFP